MKNSLFLFFIATFTLFTGWAFAGTTSLTTYFPPPTAAYNKVNLATNAGSVSCTASNSGTLFVDSTGTLNICMNGTATVYPQECYNSFCSYDPTVYTKINNPCVTQGFTTNAVGATNPTCKSGFQAIGIAQAHFGVAPNFDVFNTSDHTTVISAVCCTVSTANPATNNIPFTTTPGDYAGATQP